MPAQIIDFQLQRDIRNWESLLQRVYEICTGLGCGNTLVDVQNIILLNMISEEKNEEIKKHMQGMLIENPENNELIIKAVALLKKENHV